MRRRLMERLFHLTAFSAAGLLVAILAAILVSVAAKGIGTLTWAMVSTTPKSGFYLGGGGGIANAIVGSIYLGIGATLLAALISLPTVLYLRAYAANWFAGVIRALLDILWGVPSIIFGAFGFAIMIAAGLHASLLAGIITVALFELPIMIRAIDEVVKMVPRELEEVAYAIGATRFETAWRVVARQALPGMLTGGLLAFGRGIGDAASVLFTMGFTDFMPEKLTDQAATLPLSIFFQLSSPFAEVQQRAYSAALVLITIVLSTGILSRLISMRYQQFVVK